MDLGLSGKTALILGDDLPPGRACAKALEAEGVRVLREPQPDIDIIVAAYAPAPPLKFSDLDLEATVLVETWDEVAKLAAVYQGAIDGMKQRRWGRLIYVGPIEAKRMDGSDEVAGRVLGLGMLGMQKTIGGELGDNGITANSVLYDPDLKPDAELYANVGAAAAYLASIPAAYLTGVVMNVDASTTRGVF